MLDALGAQAGTLEGPGRPRAHDPRAARLRRLRPARWRGKTCSAACCATAPATAPSVTCQHHRLRDLRAARRRALRRETPSSGAAGRWIAHHQDADGGYSFAGGGSSDVDDTAAALQGLIDAGIRSGASVTRAVAFIEHAQNPDGGFPAEPHQESNAQSTAWAIQGLVAAGVDVGAVRDRGSRSPLGYLESLVAPNGSVRYSRTSAQTPVWVTAQALAALALEALPGRPRELRADAPRTDRPSRWIRGPRVRAREAGEPSAGSLYPCARERLPCTRRVASARRSRCAAPRSACSGLAADLGPGRARARRPLARRGRRSTTSPSSAAPASTGLASDLLHLLDPLLYTLWALLLVAVALLRRRPRVALAVAIVLPAAPLSAELLKPLLAHPHAHVGYQWIGAASWPSGHATAAMTLVLCALLVAPHRLRPTIAVLGSAFAVAVGFSLLILAWHMPSDVLGGYLLAALFGSLALAALRAAEARRPSRRPRSALPGPRARDSAVPGRARWRSEDLLAPATIVLGRERSRSSVAVLVRAGQVASFAGDHRLS